MFDFLPVEASPNDRRRILFIVDEPRLRSLVSTFLFTMGWACTAATCAELETVFKREPFDAVVLEAGRSATAIETALLKIKELRPSLLTKILVICSGLTPAAATELIERYNLNHILQENLIQQLWCGLQNLFAPSHVLPPTFHHMQSAQVTFDSSRVTVSMNVRGARANYRQLVYQHRNATIDVLIEPREDSSRIMVLGQVLQNQSKKAMGDGLTVLLVSGMTTMARTRTNEFGEFRLQTEPIRDACVEVRLREGTWVSLPIGDVKAVV